MKERVVVFHITKQIININMNMFNRNRTLANHAHRTFFFFHLLNYIKINIIFRKYGCVKREYLCNFEIQL